MIAVPGRTNRLASLKISLAQGEEDWEGVTHGEYEEKKKQ